MRVTRTEQVYIRENSTVSNLCHISKNLYNQVNYILRQQFFNHEKMSNYYSLVRQFQPDEQGNYQKLPAQTAQWTIKKVIQAWTSYFKAMGEYRKDPKKFAGMPKPPRYKEKDGEFMLIFTNQQCRIENGILKFPKIMNLEVKTRLNDVDLREVRIVPQGAGYMVEIVYSKEINAYEAKHRRVMGIDIGVRNIVTIADNISGEGIAVRGGVLKSINQYFNKEYARLKAVSDRQVSRKLTKREKKLFANRNRKIKDIMHKLSKAIISYALTKNIDTIVIGHNPGWKQSPDLGHMNNQNFVQMPFNTLINQIKYKGQEAGIDVVILDESYTSKCSFLDSESVEKHDTYMGRRIKRGIFQSHNGTLIHADLNAAYNTIKKAIPEAFADGVLGYIQGV